MRRSYVYLFSSVLALAALIACAPSLADAACAARDARSSACLAAAPADAALSLIGFAVLVGAAGVAVAICLMWKGRSSER